jgi:hypothetical protein
MTGPLRLVKAPMPEVIRRKDARDRCLKRYFTGRPVNTATLPRDLRVMEATSNGSCVECGIAAQQTPERKAVIQRYRQRARN